MKLKQIEKMIVGVWLVTLVLLTATIYHMIAVPNSVMDYVLFGIEVFVLIPLCIYLPIKVKRLTPDELDTFEKKEK